MSIDLGGTKGITCSRCRFHVRYDTLSNIIPDVMAVHWFDHHGLVRVERHGSRGSTPHGDYRTR